MAIVGGVKRRGETRISGAQLIIEADRVLIYRSLVNACLFDVIDKEVQWAIARVP